MIDQKMVQVDDKRINLLSAHRKTLVLYIVKGLMIVWNFVGSSYYY